MASYYPLDTDHTRAHSAGDRRGLGRRRSRFRHAPHRLALHMRRRLASFPRKHPRHDCLTTPFHPSPWQELEVFFFAERFEQQAAGEVVEPPVSNSGSVRRLRAPQPAPPPPLDARRPLCAGRLLRRWSGRGVRSATARPARRRHARACVVVWSWWVVGL